MKVPTQGYYSPFTHEMTKSLGALEMKTLDCKSILDEQQQGVMSLIRIYKQDNTQQLFIHTPKMIWNQTII